MAKPTSVSWLGSVDTFEAAFPKIEDFVIDGQITNGGWNLPFGEGDIHISKLALCGDAIPCRNPACRRGGYEIGFLLSDMSREGISEKKISIHCSGDEGSEQGRRKGRRCCYALAGTIKITFKPQT